ncbi:type II toxin-antitoxin system YhaV family toxin [Desulfovibrio litoralis]|uniref:Toxin YhaV n=1 Tax=Desulfovibrio litoralis DSM 11393 TaxID=1121455 RepID=A0A1M7T7S9_9BACT|nr:type II toxin-antitoxin system YhaV family toxin [Desulfovibrio litoralis]SHN66754.1 toxin YhaV [Desulfovibrio litoralis DSM 11393]
MTKNNIYTAWLGGLFRNKYQTLFYRALVLKEKDPNNFKQHPDAKLFGTLQNLMPLVCEDPEHINYRLGKTLGKSFNHWRRVKRHGLSDRYRLFFLPSKKEQKVCFAWLNDECTLRKDGSKTDVYKVFKKKLKNKKIANQIEELLLTAQPFS